MIQIFRPGCSVNEKLSQTPECIPSKGKAWEGSQCYEIEDLRLSDYVQAWRIMKEINLYLV